MTAPTHPHATQQHLTRSEHTVSTTIRRAVIGLAAAVGLVAVTAGPAAAGLALGNHTRPE